MEARIKEEHWEDSGASFREREEETETLEEKEVWGEATTHNSVP